MGNETNVENWAAHERLCAIERAVWWRGWVMRKDLVQLFGVSLAQASSDMQRYLELNPGGMVYQLNRKRYERGEGMRCVLRKPSFEDGLRCFLAGEMVAGMSMHGVIGGDRVVGLTLPVREASDEVKRELVQAVLGGLRLEVCYLSLSSGRKRKKRWLVPHAFGHDGYRWHVRAWCEENLEYRDFVLSRFETVVADGECSEEGNLPRDEDWFSEVEVVVRPNPALSDGRRKSLELDYGLRKGGLLRVKVREAMREYLLAHLRVASVELPNHFELVK